MNSQNEIEYKTKKAKFIREYRRIEPYKRIRFTKKQAIAN